MALSSFTRMTQTLQADEDINSGVDPERALDLTKGLLKAAGNLVQAAVVSKDDKKEDTKDQAKVTLKI